MTRMLGQGSGVLSQLSCGAVHVLVDSYEGNEMTKNSVPAGTEFLTLQLFHKVKLIAGTKQAAYPQTGEEGVMLTVTLKYPATITATRPIISSVR